jgi:hypothetical protein
MDRSLYYYGDLEAGVQDTQTPLASFGKGRKGAREQYEEFLTQSIPHGRRPQLVAGGVVRGLGGDRSFPWGAKLIRLSRIKGYGGE